MSIEKNSNQKKQEVREFVKQWMDSHEPDTFVKNKYDAFIYTAKHSSLNLVLFFESLLEDYIDETKKEATPVSKLFSLADIDRIIKTVDTLDELKFKLDF